MTLSQIPVLTLLPKLFPIKRVLEIGTSGDSTYLFCNKFVYPNLIDLVCVEENNSTRGKMIELFKDEKRAIFLPSVPANLFGYDLIFVDGPKDPVKRAKTIKFIMWRPDKELIPALICLHDIEYQPFKYEVNKKYHGYTFTFCKSPMTAVYRNTPLPRELLKKKNRIMAKYFEEFNGEWNKWREVL